LDTLAGIRVHLPTSCPERALLRAVALNLMAAVPRGEGQGSLQAASQANQPPARCTKRSQLHRSRPSGAFGCARPNRWQNGLVRMDQAN